MSTCVSTIQHFIFRRHVLTAEHCTVGENNLMVYAGIHHTSESYISSRAYSVVDKWELDAEDAAILEVDRDFDMSDGTIRPICLPTNVNEDYAGQTATVTGWGRLASGGDTPSELYEVDVPV